MSQPLRLVTKRRYQRFIEAYEDQTTKDRIIKEQQWGVSDEEAAKRFYAAQYGPESKPGPNYQRVSVGGQIIYDTPTGDMEFGDVAIDARSGLPRLSLGNGNEWLIDGKFDVTGTGPSDWTITPKPAYAERLKGFNAVVANGMITRG